jgi:SNF2 family DNA or RNA helicase
LESSSRVIWGRTRATDRDTQNVRTEIKGLGAVSSATIIGTYEAEREVPNKVETTIDGGESQLPDEVETIVKCQMSNLQLRLYDQICNHRLGGGEMQRKKALNNLGNC